MSPSEIAVESRVRVSRRPLWRRRPDIFARRGNSRPSMSSAIQPSKCSPTCLLQYRPLCLLQYSQSPAKSQATLRTSPPSPGCRTPPTSSPTTREHRPSKSKSPISRRARTTQHGRQYRAPHDIPWLSVSPPRKAVGVPLRCAQEPHSHARTPSRLWTMKCIPSSTPAAPQSSPAQAAESVAQPRSSSPSECALAPHPCRSAHNAQDRAQARDRRRRRSGLARDSRRGREDRRRGQRALRPHGREQARAGRASAR